MEARNTHRRDRIVPTHGDTMTDETFHTSGADSAAMPTPYVRPLLAATSLGTPRPSAAIEGWLTDLDDLLLNLGFLAPVSQSPGLSRQARSPTIDSAADAVDLIVLWARLRRCRPELLDQLQASDQLEPAGREFHSRAADVATLALEAIALEGWVDDAEALDASFETDLAGTTRLDNAIDLLTDLDDVELIVWFAQQAGLSPPVMEGELRRCQKWMQAHPDAFLDASVYIQAMGQAFRPDLQVFDPALGRTADKWVWCLNALETAEVALAPKLWPELVPEPPQPVTPASQSQQLWSQVTSPSFLISADVREWAPTHCCRWKSPDAPYEIQLIVPKDIADSEQNVSFEFCSLESESLAKVAQRFRGRSVETFDEAGGSIDRFQVDDSGCITLLWRDLKDKKVPHALKVEGEPQDWLRADD